MLQELGKGTNKMATVKSAYSPMHETCQVGYPYGVPDSGYQCGFHTGIDFPQSGVATQNPNLYPCLDSGTVVYTYTSSTRNKSSTWKSSTNKRRQNRFIF